MITRGSAAVAAGAAGGDAPGVFVFFGLSISKPRRPGPAQAGSGDGKAGAVSTLGGFGGLEQLEQDDAAQDDGGSDRSDIGGGGGPARRRLRSRRRAGAGP